MVSDSTRATPTSDNGRPPRGPKLDGMSFAFSALAFVLAMVSLGITLEHVSGEAGKRAMEVGSPALLVLLGGAGCALLVRSGQAKTLFILFATLTASSLCMLLSRLSSVEAVRIAFSAASVVLVLTGLVASVVTIAIGRRPK
jgi:hypothetical protein